MDCETVDYYEITSQLDPREILRYLNNLGIRNISGEVLKYFITDLKKLIKYDLQHRSEELSTRTLHSEVIWPERLHTASTFSSRIKSKVHEAEVKCNKECERSKKQNGVRSIRSAPNLIQLKPDDIPRRRACSCVRVDKKHEMPKETPTTSVCSNLIKVPKQLVKKKSDPVSLYHYYSSLWAKYKANLPGENDWSDLRWNIRQKLVGNVAQTSSKHSEIKEKHAVKKKKTPTTD